MAGGDRSQPIDIAMMVWPIRTSGGRIVLVDAGFYREKFIQQWKPRDTSGRLSACDGLGIEPEDVTDVIITHVHWDHADGADLFPKARVWIQRQEYEHHIGEGGTVLDRAVDPAVAVMLFQATPGRPGRRSSRATTARSRRAFVSIPAASTRSRRSTSASQTRAGTVILASDNAYLYENLEKHLAIAQTLDAASNLAAQKRMATLAGGLRLIVPGHDPAVFTRFASAGKALHAIR